MFFFGENECQNLQWKGGDIRETRLRFVNLLAPMFAISIWNALQNVREKVTKFARRKLASSEKSGNFRRWLLRTQLDQKLLYALRIVTIYDSFCKRQNQETKERGNSPSFAVCKISNCNERWFLLDRILTYSWKHFSPLMVAVFFLVFP